MGFYNFNFLETGNPNKHKRPQASSVVLTVAMVLSSQRDESQ